MGTKIYKVLNRARTVEPYPVWMTWEGVAQRVYGYSFETRNAQQCVSRLSSVGVVRYKNGRTAGPRIYPTSAETWMLQQVQKVFSDVMVPVDSARYRPPTKEEVVEAFINGIHNPHVPVDLAEVVGLVNLHCKTSFDASEVSWWRLGFEQRQTQERHSCLARMARAMGQLRDERERQEIEARKVWVGPWRVDLASLTECPCCGQKIAVPSAVHTRAASL
ncbi:hypothetical protein [Streptomyces sp. NPDC001770]